MNLYNLTFQSIRFLLLPVALVYGAVVWVRNKLYDRNILKGATFNMPLICVGNLSVGGTGKSPMTEYLLRLLQQRYEVATLSRGYKRKTRGYVLATDHTTALEIGDEPMSFHLKFPKVAVAAGEERLVAIPQLLQDRPDTQVIILDDAFQHRRVKAGLNILLTDYNNLYTRDFYLPTGDLRDWRGAAARANMIVVTKCPRDLTDEQRRQVTAEIAPREGQHVFFATLEYGHPYHIAHNGTQALDKDLEVLLVCGIANPKPLKQYLETQTASFEVMAYNDHHIFTIDDLKAMRRRFEQMPASHKILLTTEKDGVRLLKFSQELDHLPLFVLPVRHRLLFGEEDLFNSTIFTFIDNFHI
ncbi:MAG TPA: tetraacyldisaccharide 4'-kinase [Dinghuibacter sp.]|jgi:tetraacyldisaccharide 4'-kinase|uniref:tetraacyldisaccharide 4'-kinase n=1 Tax=Dinghuibacter sp. TaxID=2024697 RepID=UPI002BE4F5C5|nr:tetraacyldisaccharide 4'-kinase [Dinghuibacter sp.]HTJ12546.1 tetraacyldisaccharide 4'-kinase [Dinghuibacter sp.]